MKLCGMQLQLYAKRLNTARRQKVELLGAIKIDKWAGTTKEGTAHIHEQSCYLPTLCAKEFPQCLYLQKHSSSVNILVCTSIDCGACTGVGLLGATHNWSSFSHFSDYRVKGCKCRAVFAWARQLGLFSMDPKMLTDWRVCGNLVHHCKSWVSLCCDLLGS